MGKKGRRITSVRKKEGGEERDEEGKRTVNREGKKRCQCEGVGEDKEGKIGTKIGRGLGWRERERGEQQ